MTPMLKKCVELLEIIRAKETLQPSDVHQLDLSVKGNAELYVWLSEGFF